MEGVREATAATSPQPPPPPPLPQLVCARPARGRDVLTARCSSPGGTAEGAREASDAAGYRGGGTPRTVNQADRTCCLRGEDWGYKVHFSVQG